MLQYIINKLILLQTRKFITITVTLHPLTLHLQNFKLKLSKTAFSYNFKFKL